MKQLAAFFLAFMLTASFSMGVFAQTEEPVEDATSAVQSEDAAGNGAGMELEAPPPTAEPPTEEEQEPFEDSSPSNVEDGAEQPADVSSEEIVEPDSSSESQPADNSVNVPAADSGSSAPSTTAEQDDSSSSALPEEDNLDAGEDDELSTEAGETITLSNFTFKHNNISYDVVQSGNNFTINGTSTVKGLYGGMNTSNTRINFYTPHVELLTSTGRPLWFSEYYEPGSQMSYLDGTFDYDSNANYILYKFTLELSGQSSSRTTFTIKIRKYTPDTVRSYFNIFRSPSYNWGSGNIPWKKVAGKDFLYEYVLPKETDYMDVLFAYNYNADMRFDGVMYRPGPNTNSERLLFTPTKSQYDFILECSGWNDRETIYAPTTYRIRLESPKSGFVTQNGKTYYYRTGTKLTGWQTIASKKYYFDSTGVMKTGWQNISSKKYYFNTTGAMLTGWQTISGQKYYFDNNGTMKTGWQNIGDKKFYFKETGGNGVKGKLLTGWQTISGKKFYFKPDGGNGVKGKMMTGWQTISGKKFYFKPDGGNGVKGKMMTGWQTINGKKYYFQTTGGNGVMGKMMTGTVTISGVRHKFDANGVWKGKA